MKRFYVILLLWGLFSVFNAFGQEVRKHVVQRGETLESIAKDYDIPTTELKNANNDFELFYTGLEINVPINKPVLAYNETNQLSDSDEQFLKAYLSYVDDCEIADKFFEARNYSKAQKQYQQIIKKYKGILPCEDALYGNALCSYNREKWKSAIKDLSIVINNEDCSQNQRNHCKKLLAKAQSYRAQQIENRSNFWGGLVMTAATVGVAYMNAKSETNTVSGTAASGTNAINDDTNSYVETESDSEQTFKKSSKVCRRCHGDGKCFQCHGKGIRTDNMFGTGVDPRHDCGVCGGDGKCHTCNGTGKQS